MIFVLSPAPPLTPASLFATLIHISRQHKQWGAIMRQLLLGLTLTLCLQSLAFARLGETPEQCEKRYGKAIKEIPGHGLVDFCRLYEKKDIKISAIFIKGRTTPAVGCILYSTHRREGVWLINRRLTADEQTGLLATVPGKWKLPSANPAPTLRGGGPVRELTVKPNSIGDSRMKESQATISAVLDALYPCSLQRAIHELGRNGPDKYAFAFLGGIGITYHKASDAVVEWSKSVQTQRAEDAKPDPKNVKGF